MPLVSFSYLIALDRTYSTKHRLLRVSILFHIIRRWKLNFSLLDNVSCRIFFFFCRCSLSSGGNSPLLLVSLANFLTGSWILSIFFSVFISMKVKVAQLYLTLWNPMDYTVHGILKARILQWVAFPFSRGSSQPKDQTHVSHIAGRFFTSWATRKAHSLVWSCDFSS